jgi:hypothetical protein
VTDNPPPACTCDPPPTTPSGHRMNCPDWRGGGEVAEAAAETPHACSNCEGIDPGSCLMNPDRTTATPGWADLLGAAPEILADGRTVEQVLGREPGAGADDVHARKPGASLYYCPTRGETESDLHQQLVPCGAAVLHRPHAAHSWAVQPGMDPVRCVGSADRTVPTCGAPHATYPETMCTEPPLHRLPHGGPLIVDGRERGGAAWGPDHGTAPATPGRTETGATTPTAQATGMGADEAAAHATPDAGTLRDRIVAAILERQNPGFRYTDREDLTLAEWEADAVLAVVQPVLTQATKERDAYRREADRLRGDWVTMRTRAETAAEDLMAETRRSLTAEARAEEVEATTARVYAECDRIEAAVRTNPTAPDFDGAYLTCLKHIRAALTRPEPDTTNGEQP